MDSKIPLLGIHSREWKHVHTKLYTQMFTAALFRVDKKAEKPQMSINWWRQNAVYPENDKNLYEYSIQALQ